MTNDNQVRVLPAAPLLMLLMLLIEYCQSYFLSPRFTQSDLRCGLRPGPPSP